MQPVQLPSKGFSGHEQPSEAAQDMQNVFQYTSRTTPVMLTAMLLHLMLELRQQTCWKAVTISLHQYDDLLQQ